MTQSPHASFIALLAFMLVAPVAPASAEEWTDLFDGKTLDGWVIRGGKATYAVKDGAIVGTTAPSTPNTFLCTEKEYGDFVLEYEFKCHPELNSGVQIRSQQFDAEKVYDIDGKTIKVPANRVHGYQVEIDANKPDRAWMSGIYDEARRGWLYPGPKGGDGKAFGEQGRKLYKPEDWNTVRVVCSGDHIVTYLNGEKRADFRDDLTPKGFIGLQVHGVGKREDPIWVMWRNIKIRPLNPDEVATQDVEAGAWVDLFNGKNLDGWKNPYGWGKAEVVDGEIHLTADKKFFLVTEKTYGDFVLEAQIMLPAQGPANSGIMYRCHVEPNKVYGYQAECDPSDRAWTGGLYDEGRRGWLWPTNDQRGKTKLVQAPLGEWVSYRIQCVGDHLQVWVNGQVTTDHRDDVDASGHIGIQHHGEKGQTYRFRNIRIRELSK